MTQQLRLTHSDEEVADYLRWIITSDTSKSYHESLKQSENVGVITDEELKIIAKEYYVPKGSTMTTDHTPYISAFQEGFKEATKRSQQKIESLNEEIKELSGCTVKQKMFYDELEQKFLRAQDEILLFFEKIKEKDKKIESLNEIVKCECGHNVPLEFSISDKEDGNATCMPCFIEHLKEQHDIFHKEVIKIYERKDKAISDLQAICEGQKNSLIEIAEHLTSKNGRDNVGQVELEAWIIILCNKVQAALTETKNSK